MDSEYQQFQFPAANSFSSQYSVNLQTGKTRVGHGDSVLELLLETHLVVCAGVKRTLVYVPYGLLLLLLFILLLLTGIKCTWSKHQSCWFTSLLFFCSKSMFSLFYSQSITRRDPRCQHSPEDSEPRMGNLHRRFWFDKSTSCCLGFLLLDINSTRFTSVFSGWV